MFIAYSLANCIAAYLIFSHQFQGGAASFMTGMGIALIVLLHRMERGSTFSASTFTLVFFPLIGSLGLAGWIYKDALLDNFDQVMVIFLSYLCGYLVMGLAGYTAYFCKSGLLWFIAKRDEKLVSYNNAIFMQGSNDEFLTDEQVKKKKGVARKFAWTVSLIFLTVTSWSIMQLGNYIYASDVMLISFDQQTMELCASVWFAAVFAYMGCSLPMLLAAAILHLGFLLASMSIIPGQPSFHLADLCVRAVIFLSPAVGMFLLTCSRIGPSFKEY